MKKVSLVSLTLLKLSCLFVVLDTLLLSSLPVVDAVDEWRSFDGRNNNLNYSFFGTPLQACRPLFFAPWSPRYKDGKGEVFHTDDLRNITLSLFGDSWQVFDKQIGLSVFTAQFSRSLFLDIGRAPTECSLQRCEPQETYQIKVPRCDTFLDPSCSGNATMPVSRAFYAKGTGISINSTVSVPRQVVYDGTAWLDLDYIYGLDPVNSPNRFHKNSSTDPNFRRGELWLPTENYFTSLLKTSYDPMVWQWIYIWSKEHNRRAGIIANDHLDWSEEKVFQSARKWTIGLYQKIVTRDYISATTGLPLRPYVQYNPFLPPMIDPVTKHVIARYGHFSQSNFVQFLDENFEPFEQYQFPAAKFETDWLSKGYHKKYLAHYIRGQVGERAYDPTKFQVASMLLSHPTKLDVMAIDLFRTQDVGLPLFNQARRAYQAINPEFPPPIKTWEDLTSNNRTQNLLKSLYKSVEDLELFLGVFAEDPRPGGHVSMFVSTILWAQLTVLRDTDRFWYEMPNYFAPDELGEIFNTTLGDILHRTVDGLGDLFPTHPFYVQNRQLNSQSSGALFSSDKSDYENQLDLSNSFRLSWTANVDTQIIKFKLEVAAAGWVGIGWDSDDGTMKNGDMVFCRWINEEPLIIDSFAVDVGPPVADDDARLNGTQDIFDTAAEKSNGIYTYRFSRKFMTLDNFDKPFTNSVQKLLFAYHPATMELAYHGPTRNVSRYINLLSQKTEEQVSRALIIVSSIIVGCGLLLGLCVFLITFSHSDHFRFSSVVFVRLSTIGAITGLVSAILMFPRPTGNLCIASFWILGVSFYIIFGLTSVKIWRLYIIYRQLLNDQFLPLKPPSNQMLLMCASLCVIGECIFHIIWVTVDKLDAERVLNGNQYWYRCKSNLAFWMIFVVSKLVFLLMTSVMCFLSRKIPHKYSEAGRLSVTVYGVFVTVCVVLPLGFAVDNVNGRFVIQVFPIFITFFGFLICVFGPIMIRIISGQDAVDMRKMLREITMVDTKRGGAKATHIISSSTHQSAPSVNNSNE